MLPARIFESIVHEKEQNVVKILKDSFAYVHKGVENMISEFSGSTLTAVMVQGRTLFAANAGDSRAIIVQEGSGIR